MTNTLSQEVTAGIEASSVSASRIEDFTRLTSGSSVQPEQLSSLAFDFPRIDALIWERSRDEYATFCELFDQEMVRDPQFRIAATIINTLFITSRVSALRQLLRDGNLSLDQFPVLPKDSILFKVIGLMVEDSTKFAFELGVLLATILAGELPESILTALAPSKSSADLSILVGHGDWKLCNESENYLHKSFKAGSLVLVNGFLLLKYFGKRVALCLQTTQLPNGQFFIANNWYALVDELTLHASNDVFDSGDATLQVPSGQWALLRRLRRDSENDFSSDKVFRTAQRYVTLMQSKLPDMMLNQNRRNFRLDNFEEF